MPSILVALPGLRDLAAVAEHANALIGRPAPGAPDYVVESIQQAQVARAANGLALDALVLVTLAPAPAAAAVPAGVDPDTGEIDPEWEDLRRDAPPARPALTPAQEEIADLLRALGMTGERATTWLARWNVARISALDAQAEQAMLGALRRKAAEARAAAPAGRNGAAR
jgi:hypothetical protein